jgi:hypothetical protein
MSKYDSVWETHDFVIKKLTENEDKYNHLLGNISIYVDMYKEGSLPKKKMSSVISDGRKICKSLRSLYDKHLLTIREIRELIEDEDIPEERVPTAEVVDELEESTRNLMTTISQSEELFNFIEEDLRNG